MNTEEGRLRAAPSSFWQESRGFPGIPASVTAVTKPLLLAALAFVAFMLLYPQVRDRLPQSMHYERSSMDQSPSQLSSEEFGEIDSTFTPEKLGGFAGKPATKTNASVEGVDLECWYYGVAGARGAYQICFENGRLSAKSRFGQ